MQGPPIVWITPHGAVKPTGRRRTWPHELTREAVMLQTDLSFLSPGIWQAGEFVDDSANPATFNRESKVVKVGDKLMISMRQRGGAVVWITKSAW